MDVDGLERETDKKLAQCNGTMKGVLHRVSIAPS
jgi:hypothetical protein